jgi:predicted RNA binding protein YcfA (HicA-like mRNA interferase family)
VKDFCAVKVREIVRILQNDGWFQVRMKGSHRHFKHNLKTGLVTVPGNPGKELAKGTLGSIFKQAGLNK